MRADPANAKDRHFDSAIVDCYDHFSRIADDQSQSTIFGFLLINGGVQHSLYDAGENALTTNRVLPFITKTPRLLV